MSFEKTNPMIGIEEKIEPVDIESLANESKDIFEQSYSSDILKKAAENREQLRKSAEDKALSKLNSRQKSLQAVDKGLKVETNARLSYFEKEQVYTNEWTNSTMDLLEELYLQCKKSSEAHAAAARACRKKHRMLSIPTVLVATAATSASFFQAGSSCDADTDDSDNLKYTVACLTSLVSILGGIAALYNFNSKMNDNINAAGSYANLARRAKIQIFLPNHLRAQAEVVLTDISAEHAYLTQNSPLL